MYLLQIKTGPDGLTATPWGQLDATSANVGGGSRDGPTFEPMRFEVQFCSVLLHFGFQHSPSHPPITPTTLSIRASGNWNLV